MIHGYRIVFSKKLKFLLFAREGTFIEKHTENYKNLLKQYIETGDEEALYQADKISKTFLRAHILPDEIVHLHRNAMLELYPEAQNDFQRSLFFLLEVMISYGITHQEFQTLREEQLKLKSEIQVAANMQQTLLATKIPEVNGFDIGVISVPAEQLNGDYYNFIEGEEGALGIAIADIVGKGVPAALSMSMIKYAMDSFPDSWMSPTKTLTSLNRVVERNVESNMFVTMFYAQYLPKTSKLYYASAGHEPGYYYDAKKNTFEEIKVEGIVLGVLPNVDYKQYEMTLQLGDMVILLTDGVTECKKDGAFIEKEEVLHVIKKYIHLPCQEIVNQVYKHFERLQDFQLRDDFTLIILRKEV